MDVAVVKEELRTICHWYEEKPGTISSTRVYTAFLIVLAFLVFGLMAALSLIPMLRTPHEKPDSTMIEYLAGALTAICANIASNVAFRNKGVPD